MILLVVSFTDYYMLLCIYNDMNDWWVSLFHESFPAGESPSSSASDVDNLNNQVMLEKATIPKGASHDGGNHVILAQNSNFVRLLDFVRLSDLVHTLS